MSKSNITSLQETSAGSWQAKYRGNYGDYTIKINIDGTKMGNFSCSCPSDYYPCKHIAIVAEAIKDQIDKNEKFTNGNSAKIDAIMKGLSHSELVEFMTEQMRYNQSLANALLLKYTHKTETAGNNKYNEILRQALDGIDFDYEDLYEYQDEAVEIDVLNDWLKRAEQHIAQGYYHEAEAICKACIEEYAEWLKNIDSDMQDYIDPFYMEEPFELLSKMAEDKHIDIEKCFAYCQNEMSKSKYSSSNFLNNFSNLMLKTAKNKDTANIFLKLQDTRFLNLQNKDSYEAKNILQQKIALYRQNNNHEAAWNILTENLQIEDFRMEVVKRRIEEGNFTEAKQLIKEYLDKKGTNSYGVTKWNELLLQIAEKENNKREIRRVSWLFIENQFNEKYYRLYKSTFSEAEWDVELEKIIQRYTKNVPYFRGINLFIYPVADVLVEEKAIQRLLKYVETNLSVEAVDRYYTVFVHTYPAETLNIFQKAIDDYADKNLGREHYKYIAGLLKKMLKIKDGNEVVTTMLNNYRTKYKNRRAMMEILQNIKL